MTSSTFDYIQVTMTATRRPEIVKRTLESFRNLMLGEEMRRMTIIINVDPVGHEIASVEVVNVAREYFRDVVSNCPEKPHFPTAFKWCWSKVTAPYIFNLEEDWELLTYVSVYKMIWLLSQDPDLMILRLPFSPCYETNKSWGHYLNWNGLFYDVPEDKKGLLGFCGHPSLIRKAFVEKALSIIDGVGNPEKQLKWRPGHELMKYKYGVFGYPGMTAAVKDIGREWRVKNGWAKMDNNGNDNNAFFTSWRKVNEQPTA